MSVTVKVESPTRAKLKLLKTQLRLASVDAVIQHLLLEAGHGEEAVAAADAPAEGEADEDAPNENERPPQLITWEALHSCADSLLYFTGLGPGPLGWLHDRLLDAVRPALFFLFALSLPRLGCVRLC